MRPQQSLSNRSNTDNQHDTAQSRLNQSLLIQSNFILFLLIFVSLIVNATRGYGYNVTIGCGIYFLSTKNPFLYKMFYFYMLVFMTILADGISVVLLINKVSVFHSVIAPIMEIILKLILLGLQGFRWFQQAKQEKQRLKGHQEKQLQLRRQIQERKNFQLEQRNYQVQKREKTVNPSRYYQHQKHHNLPPNYKAQVYRQFNYQEFIEEDNPTQSMRR